MPHSLQAVHDALLERFPSAQRRGDAVLRDATHDSRQAGPGTLFCAVVGFTVDGHEFAAATIEQGAVALLVERWLDLDVPQILVPSVREAMGLAAAVVHGQPSDHLAVVGITGTNGKTTTTYLVEGAVAAAGRGTGIIGTVETRIHGEAQPGVRTTPEGPDLQRLLRRMYDRGVDVVAMEVSSHGLDLFRVDGTRYAVVAFTNLTQDHLDHHGTMDAYFAAKARLFTPALAASAVVDIDDAWGRRLAAEATIPVVTYGFADDAEHRITDLVADLQGTTFRLAGPEDVTIRTRLLGDYNAANAAAAYLCARAIGVDRDAAVDGIAACPGVPGRLEPVSAGQPFAVLVDYAHTPDAVDHVVDATRALLPPGGSLRIVVGCGGDRDRGKRPLMAAAAVRADHAILTSDNPRTEDPQAILDEMTAGADAAATGARVDTILDRRQAIAFALEQAGPDDIVVIAGKGHESGQEFADRTVPFDDREVAADLLRTRGGAA